MHRQIDRQVESVPQALYLVSMLGVRASCGCSSDMHDHVIRAGRLYLLVTTRCSRLVLAGSQV